MNIKIKQMNYEDALHQEFLKEMLYQAIYVPDGCEKPHRDILNDPLIQKYYINFGSKQDDLCYIAEDMDTGIMAGAVWIRKFTKDNPSYGFVNNDTPELSIALHDDYRGMGIGTKLIYHLLNNIPQNIEQLSLSVDINNRAYKLYKKLGFCDVSVVKDTATMVYRCNILNIVDIVHLDKSLYSQIPLVYAKSFSEEPWEDNWYDIPQFNEDSVWAAICSNKVVGFIISFISKGLPYISVAAVVKEYQNSGIGKLLVKQMLAYWKGQGYNKAFVHTDTFRESTIKFYLSVGFVEVSRDDEVVTFEIKL